MTIIVGEGKGWSSLSDLDWLDYTLRGITRVRSNGESEDEGELICHLALCGFFTVTIRCSSLTELISKGRAYEENHLMKRAK